MLTKRITTVSLVACAALMLAACSATGASSDTVAPDAVTSDAAGFPRTVEIPAGVATEASTFTMESAPEAIAALDYESAEVIAALGLADRLVLAPEALTNPVLGSHVDEMTAVPNTFPVAMEVDVETVLDAKPDLVIMSPRHGAEETIGTVLEQSGVPALQLPASWTNRATLDTNVDLIGQATGADFDAEALRDKISAGLAESPKLDAKAGPRLLVLSNQAGRPFITAGNAFPLELVALAGAQSISVELGIKTTGPISAEQIVEANPDAILLIDMNGSGERLFSELLANPAVASLAGAKQTLLLEGKQVQALGLTHTAEGLTDLRRWVAGLPD